MDETINEKQKNNPFFEKRHFFGNKISFFQIFTFNLKNVEKTLFFSLFLPKTLISKKPAGGTDGTVTGKLNAHGLSNTND